MLAASYHKGDRGGYCHTKALENPSTDIRHFLSSFVVNEWESRFLRLSAAKNIYRFYQKMLEIEIVEN